MHLTTSERLAYSTLRIECEYSDGGTGTGTGFLFKFHEKGDSFVPVLITNKHVAQGAIKVRLTFTKADENYMPLDTQHFTITCEGSAMVWKMHPDDTVDLCVMAIGPFINYAKKRNINIFNTHFTRNEIPSQEQLDELQASEEILMVGYPIGLWDTVNNKPIFRRGLTATHPNKDYCGKREFLIDAACFPGSSGSPVLILNQGSFKDKKGNTYEGLDRVLLLGILYAGPQYTAQGDIQIIDIPTVQKPIVTSHIPMNLGVIIKSNRIMELETLISPVYED